MSHVKRTGFVKGNDGFMDKAKIGFIYYLYEKNLCGISKYSKGILSALARLGGSHMELCSLNRDYYQIPGVEEVQSLYSYAANPDMAMKEWYMLADLWDCRCVHSFYYPILFHSKNFRTILTIYDLSPLANNQWFGGNQEFYNMYDIDLRQSALKADHIIAISESSKHEVMDFYGISEDKISIAFPAVSFALCQQAITDEDIVDVRNKFQIKGAYLLSICTLEPRKNLPSLLKAFNLYKEKHGDSDIKLVLTGRLGWNYNKILSELEQSQFAKDIILTDYVTERELAFLIKGALAFAYISYYEGFGMPILEALHFGKAVLSSDTTSMPEVGGDAVCYCNPYDLDSIYYSLEKLLEDAAYRKSLENKAKRQAKTFSYEKSAKAIVDVYKKLGVTRQ